MDVTFGRGYLYENLWNREMSTITVSLWHSPLFIIKYRLFFDPGCVFFFPVVVTFAFVVVGESAFVHVDFDDEMVAVFVLADAFDDLYGVDAGDFEDILKVGFGQFGECGYVFDALGAFYDDLVFHNGPPYVYY